MLADMRAELSGQFEDARRKLRRAEAALSWDAPGGEPVDYEAIKRARLELEQARAEVENLKQTPADTPTEPPRPIRVGDVVRITGLNVQGAVQSIDADNGEATVIVGDARFTLDVGRLTPVEDGTPVQESRAAATKRQLRPRTRR